MTIVIRPSWPYLPPLLNVPGIADWHADHERLCIWQAEDNSQRWATKTGLYERIDEWVEDAKDGFVGVENARNPELYWQESTNAGRCFALVDLEQLIGNDRSDGQHGEFHFAEALSADGRPSGGVLELDPGTFDSRTRLPPSVTDPRTVRGRWFYRTSVTHPPRTLDELRSFLTDKQRDRLGKDLRDRTTVMFGIVWPNSAGLVATMLLTHKPNGAPESTRIHALVMLRPKGREALLLRAGADATTLQSKRVAVVGVGAIGSHICDQLVRAGIGHLRLVDFDALWPVNLVRHAAPPGTPANTPKTTVLRDTLQLYPWVQIDVPDDHDSGIVWTIGGIREVLESADLTVDATGHAGLAELMARVAADVGRPFVSAALFRGGAVARVRRQALPTDTPVLQRPHLDPYPAIPPLDEEAEYVGTETGCLAQVHNAPPSSVAHAAVLAVEVIVDHLSGRHEQPDEIIEVLRQGDPPFNQLGRLRRTNLPYTVDITESAQTELRSAASQAMPNETGGVLLGCGIDGRAVVVKALEVCDPDATDSHYCVPEGATPAVVKEAQRRDPRLGYLGEWHSHPSGAPPSSLDTATMLSVAASSDRQEPVLVLVFPNEPIADGLGAYVATDVGLRVATICATGDLPSIDDGREHEADETADPQQRRIEAVPVLGASSEVPPVKEGSL